MKKGIKHFMYIASLVLFITACEDDKDLVQLNADANSVLSLSNTTLVLDIDAPDSEILTATWSEPDFGFEAAAEYQVLIDLAGGDFTNPQSISVGSVLEKIFTTDELNSKLLNLGLTANQEATVDFKIQASLSDNEQFQSNTVTLTVTPYSSVLDLSSAWGVVGSATAGGWGNPNIPDLPFYTTSASGELVAYVTLRDGEIKFRENNDWTNNYGDDGADGSLEAGGANIAVTAGTYRILFNLNDLTYTIEPYSWGLVGSATPNGWDGPDVKMQYNSFQDNWKAVITLVDGEMKFRFNDDWTLNYGDTGADGTLEEGGDNIAVTAGHYIVTLDLNSLEYTLEAMDVWGLVGSATANGWDGPNDKFVPDFGINEGYFYLNGVELIAGEIKVRQNDAWGVNYGDDGNDGTLELNGANIPVGAGTYNITVNFNASPPTIELNAW